MAGDTEYAAKQLYDCYPVECSERKWITNYNNVTTGVADWNDVGQYYLQLTADLPDTQTGNTTSWDIETTPVACSVVNDAVWIQWCSVAHNQDLRERQTVQRAREERERVSQENQERLAGIKKAEELLFMFLTEEQKESYKKSGYFVTTVNDKTYRLQSDRRVYLMGKDGVALVSYCIHVGENAISVVPRPDELLAFKLMLEAEEEQFLRVANATRIPV